LQEQQKIADFLDKKCSHIDSILEKTKASIDECKQLKQSVITQAVTKGIRPNRPMKDSGIEWIGQIPEDWKINTVFQIFTQVKNKNEGLIEQNLLSLSYGKLKRKSIDTVGGLLPENFDGYNIIEKDDIVLRLTDLQNDHKSLRVGLARERGIITSAYVTIRNRTSNNPQYLYYYLHSFDIAKGFYGMGAGVRQGLNWDGLKWLKITTPSKNEQQEIVTYLDNKCSEIDKLITKKEKLIEELETYKKSLIYEYVTGKKEVI
jgi:type I restriction enzyme S subunit